MNSITSISWQVFFAGILLLFLVWLFTSRTKFGRSVIHNYAPWSLENWKKVLLVAGVSLFILVNPVFHILAAVVVIGLYYLFVGQQLKPIVKTGKWDLQEKIHLFDGDETPASGMSSFVCRRVESENQLADKHTLYNCLFSFPFIATEIRPKIHYLENEYNIDLKLSDEKYLSSLYAYLREAGFTITIKKDN